MHFACKSEKSNSSVWVLKITVNYLSQSLKWKWTASKIEKWAKNKYLPFFYSQERILMKYLTSNVSTHILLACFIALAIFSSRKHTNQLCSPLSCKNAYRIRANRMPLLIRTPWDTFWMHFGHVGKSWAKTTQLLDKVIT